MDSLHFLNLPDECLLMVYNHLDKKSQCLLALTCCRLSSLYHMVNRTDFRCFVWQDCFLSWKHREVRAFFILNGYKMRMLSVSDDINAFDMINVCAYLRNLRSLYLNVNVKLPEILTEVYKHMNKLESVTVESYHHPNYEILALLPRLRSLDIEYFVRTDDKIFKIFSKLRPYGLEHLRIGSELTIESAKPIPKIRSLKLLNIFNPNSNLINRIVIRVSNLKVLSITSAQQLDIQDLKNLIIKLKFLSSFYINDCRNLKDDYVFFMLEYLKGDVDTQRYLPFHLHVSRTSVSNNIKKVNLFIQKFSKLINICIGKMHHFIARLTEAERSSLKIKNHIDGRSLEIMLRF